MIYLLRLAPADRIDRLVAVRAPPPPDRGDEIARAAAGSETERPREGIYRLPTDRPRNRRSARVPAERTIRSVAFTKCPTRAARSCRFRSRALRVLRDRSRANADLSICMTRLPVPASGPYRRMGEGLGARPPALLNAGPVHAVPCPAKLSALGQPQCIVRFWMRAGSRGGVEGWQPNAPRRPSGSSSSKTSR